MSDTPPDRHEKDRAFLTWVQDPGTMSADLRAKWYELQDIGWKANDWRVIAIERELARRGEAEPI